MRWIILFLFFIFSGMILTGFYIKGDNLQSGDLLIGIGISGGVFVVMPLFLFHRWRKREVKDYMLTKDSFKKMREFEGSNEKKRRK